MLTTKQASSHFGGVSAFGFGAFALALQTSGDHNQAYEILRSIPLAAYKDLPSPLRADLQAAHVALALRLNADLKPSKLSCAPSGPLPASPEQSGVVGRLGIATCADGATGGVVVALGVSLARYADALGTLGTILPDAATSETAASVDVAGLVASTVQCFYDAQQLPLLVAVPALLDGFWVCPTARDLGCVGGWGAQSPIGGCVDPRSPPALCDVAGDAITCTITHADGQGAGGG